MNLFSPKPKPLQQPGEAHPTDGGYREALLARKHLASLSPERRAQLEKEWL